MTDKEKAFEYQLLLAELQGTIKGITNGILRNPKHLKSFVTRLYEAVIISEQSTEKLTNK